MYKPLKWVTKSYLINNNLYKRLTKITYINLNKHV